ncbi:MAG: DUF2071 domain-containing protein [Chloroflexia bacterium]
MKLRSRPGLDAAHRPWPIPNRPWLMTQTWHNLLFAHWPISPDKLRQHIPASLELETFGGQAWLGVVAFRLSKIRLRGLPEVGLVSHFNELNLRTYVTLGGKPGVLFLSMDADNALAIRMARPWFRLPYTFAHISFEKTRAGYAIESTREGGKGPTAAFRATYRPTSPVYSAQPGTLEHWLTERYCYYSPTPRRTFRCEILHMPWPLQRACAQIEANTLAGAIGIDLAPGPPLLHYARRMTALIWGLEGVGTGIKGLRD